MPHGLRHAADSILSEKLLRVVDAGEIDLEPALAEKEGRALEHGGGRGVEAGNAGKVDDGAVCLDLAGGDGAQFAVHGVEMHDRPVAGRLDAQDAVFDADPAGGRPLRPLPLVAALSQSGQNSPDFRR